MSKINPFNNTKYGLRELKSGKLVTCYNNHGEEDGQVSLSLSECYPLWLVNNKYLAEYVRNTSTKWYSSNHSTLTHSFEAENLEVVEVVLDVKKSIPTKLPTNKELALVNYKDDRSLPMILNNIYKSKELYSIYDLFIYLINMKIINKTFDLFH